MNWFTAYEKQLSNVFAESEKAIAKFPFPLDQLGLAYLLKFDATKEASTKNYICYLLPFWLSDLTSLPSEALRKLSIANVFVMLYYFIQDDIMDSPTGAHRDKLPLGNLFYLQFLSMYRELFPQESAFWTYFNEYILEWSEAVTNEGNANYFMKDIRMVSKKASPVKFASTGALLLSDQSSLVPDVSNAIDQVLVTLQMLDDWADWQEDLQDGSYNCLLAMISTQLQLPPDRPVTEELVKQHIYVHDFLTHYAQIAIAHQQQLLTLELEIPQLWAFHEALVSNLVTAATETEQHRRNLTLGGFHYLLTKQKQKGTTL